MTASLLRLARRSYSPLALATLPLLIMLVVAARGPDLSSGSTNALRESDAKLASMSERAGRLHELLRHVHKASLTTTADAPELPFVGFAGTADDVRRGKILTLGAAGKMVVVDVEPVHSPVTLSSDDASHIELLAIHVRPLGDADGHMVRVLVAVAPVKRGLNQSEPRSL